ncbi:MAG: aminopeptidase P family protein [Planctomycetes bacterium]|nr:aminopeptidase P family protein [Planctomycetota bacterium]
MSESLVIEKVEQAVGILDEVGIDAWLTFVRETTESGDPMLPIILGQPLTWPSALIVTRRGERIAIVGKYEDEAVRSTGAWLEVVPYVEGIGEPLVGTLDRLAPGRLAVNYSENDVKADGLSHGMMLRLRAHLAGTPHADALCSAEPIIASLRGRKTAGEIARIRAAIEITDAVFRSVASFARAGRCEMEIAEHMRGEAARRAATPAWDAAQCPIVSTGSDSMIGHGLPSPDLVVRAGCIFHLDFGVCLDQYCSDVQRAWYVPGDGESAPPPAVHEGFEAVAGAITAAAQTLRPGAQGWEVDAAARSALTGAGYPEYRHATGHQVGRAAHDGGAVLGPRWERYGDTPTRSIEAGSVFTLELGIENLDGRGYLGLEEMVLVTDDGCVFLTERQMRLPLLGETVGRIC